MGARRNRIGDIMAVLTDGKERLHEVGMIGTMGQEKILEGFTDVFLRHPTPPSAFLLGGHQLPLLRPFRQIGFGSNESLPLLTRSKSGRSEVGEADHGI